MYPPTIAQPFPDRIAYVMAESGEQLTYAELDAYSNQLAHLLRASGVREGDSLVLYAPNQICWPIAVAAGMRSGLFVTPVNWHLGPHELAPLLEAAAPAAIITSAGLLEDVRGALAAGDNPLVLTMDDAQGARSLRAAIQDQPTDPIADERLGARVLFSGGTTGRPKVFRQPLLGIHPTEAPARHAGLADALDFNPQMRFLSPAPNYHAAPFTFQLMVLGLGGTVVCMERFDAGAALRALNEHDITHSQWVPTMLTRLLAVPGRLDLPLGPEHVVAVTSGAPCPPDLKDQINDWWGNLLHEYYGASEGYGHTYISPEESRTHRGSVGRPLGTARVAVVDNDNAPVSTGTLGRVCFVQPGSGDLKGMGDMGHLDEDGYLYLTGRASFMIISGGVNIYPEEIENALAEHPDVADCAVVGIPDPDFGERVLAIVELREGSAADAATERALRTYCRTHLASYKIPRAYSFVERLPRLPTGKLNKTALREAYLAETQ